MEERWHKEWDFSITSNIILTVPISFERKRLVKFRGNRTMPRLNAVWKIPSLRPRVPQIALWWEMIDFEGSAVWYSPAWPAITEVKNSVALKNQERKAKAQWMTKKQCISIASPSAGTYKLQNLRLSQECKVSVSNWSQRSFLGIRHHEDFRRCLGPSCSVLKPVLRICLGACVLWVGGVKAWFWGGGDGVNIHWNAQYLCWSIVGSETRKCWFNWPSLSLLYLTQAPADASTP